MDVQPVRGRLFDFNEALVFLGMPAKRLRRLVARKRIPVIRDGRLGFYEDDLKEWIAAHRTPASGPTRIALPDEIPPQSAEPSGIDDLLVQIRRRGGSPFDHERHAHEVTDRRVPAAAGSDAGHSSRRRGRGDRTRRRGGIRATTAGVNR